MKRLIFLLTFLVFIGLSFSLSAQRTCATMDHFEQEQRDHPNRLLKIQEIERHTQKVLQGGARAVEGVITIPVVFHIVYNTASENISVAQVQSQLDVLNEDFRRLNADRNNTPPDFLGVAADVEIQFCLATVDPTGNATNGITRTQTNSTSFGTNDQVKFNSSGGKDAWPASQYLNFWVCDISGNILGYAQFPGGPASTDGVVIDYAYFGTIGTATAPFDLGRTATHEVGHWLNLRHIWGDGGCGVDDFVADTPTAGGANYTGSPCTYPGPNSCNQGANDLPDMFQNYMDYSDDGCMNLFTSGQTARMRALFEPGGSRESLLTSNGCGTPVPATCEDGIQNGDETGVDCGGSNCAPCSCPQSPLTLTIKLDNYPEETSWRITNANNAIVASGGTYGAQPDGSTVTETINLAAGDYTFTISDSYSDGICCLYGNGSYTLADANGAVVVTGGSFGASESTIFCASEAGTTPTCTDGIQNGQETGVDCGGPDCPTCPTEPTCSDGIQNGQETGVDCGGPDCPSCPTEPTCSDGIQNGQETGIDCGGPDCPACDPGGCTTVTLESNDFESGWGLWNDGGSDARLSASDQAFANSGIYCVRLRDNTSSSTMYTNNLDLTAFEEITIDFSYYARSMDNPTEGFLLEISLNGGASYTAVEEWNLGDEFQNNQRKFDQVVIPGPFSANTIVRLRCDASSNSDYVYIDDVTLSGCQSGARVAAEDLRGGQQTVAPSLQNVLDVTFSNVNLFPNPSKGELTLSFDMVKNATVQVILTDLSGKVMSQAQITLATGPQRKEMDTSKLPAGIYFMHLVTKEERIAKKFVVIK
ncbi:MAG: M43 family zinc metalloprotease [Saprospiraceae bacterium]